MKVERPFCHAVQRLNSAEQPAQLAQVGRKERLGVIVRFIAGKQHLIQIDELNILSKRRLNGAPGKQRFCSPSDDTADSAGMASIDSNGCTISYADRSVRVRRFVKRSASGCLVNMLA